MIELTPQQHDILTRNGKDVVRALDPGTNVEYVLLRAELYDRFREMLNDDLPGTATLINEVMAADDANDPYLESYQQFRQDRR
ncbi:MAG: hypothetical protein HY040_11245 [Planctomycetes bacterium]|nr:hypothetical protein [Planctomycetota bacterium]